MYFKTYFLLDSHCKMQDVFSDFLKITLIFWTLLRVTLPYHELLEPFFHIILLPNIDWVFKIITDKWILGFLPYANFKFDNKLTNE